MPHEFELPFEFAVKPPSDADAAAPTPRGVHVAKQARSRLKQEALLQAGRRLLGEQDLATLSVARLTRDARMSVGSFYSRFADKEAWFAELLRLSGDEVLEAAQALLASPRWTRAPVQRKVALVVQQLVAVHREHRGILRAALADNARTARFGVPLHAYGERLADAVHAALAPHLVGVPPAQRRRRVGIALQLVYGMLVNAVLRDPGPIRLDDPRMARELTEVFLSVVRLER